MANPTQDMTVSELIRLKQAVISLRESVIPRLHELESSIDVLLPPEPGRATPMKCDIETIRSWCKDTNSKKQK